MIRFSWLNAIPFGGLLSWIVRYNLFFRCLSQLVDGALSGRFPHMTTKNLYSIRPIADIQEVMISRGLLRPSDPDSQHRRQRFLWTPGQAHTKSIVYSFFSQQTTTFHRIESSICLFFRDADLLRHVLIFSIDIVLQPWFRNACYTRNSCNRELLQQQFIDQFPGLFGNHFFLRVFDKLSSTLFAFKFGSTIMNRPVFDNVLWLTLWT